MRIPIHSYFEIEVNELPKKVRKVAKPAEKPVAVKPPEHPCPACGLEMQLVNENPRYKMFNCAKCGLSSYLDKKRVEA